MPRPTQFEQQDATDQIFAIKTWRYLRASMIGFVLAIFIGVGFERSKAPGCFQTSISAYYYTPVHGVFIGALVAVGTCLICLRGNTDAEDILLNLAGMFAPVVALVPTPGTGSCGSVLTTADNRDVNIGNNMFVLLAVGAAGFVFLAVIAIVGRVRHGSWPPRLKPRSPSPGSASINSRSTSISATVCTRPQARRARPVTDRFGSAT